VSNTSVRDMASLPMGTVARFLVLLGIVLQVVPFCLEPAIDSSELVILVSSLPETLRPLYEVSDAEAAIRFRTPLVFSRLARLGTQLAFLMVIFLSFRRKIPVARSTWRKWGHYLGFFVVLFLGLAAVGLPYRIGAYIQHKAFLMTDMDVLGWMGAMVQGALVPMALFVFQGILLVCFLHIFPRRWWLVTPLCFFLLLDVVPQFFTFRPRDSLDTLTPLSSGPYWKAMDSIARKEGLDLALFVDDHSRRVKSVNFYLRGRLKSRYVVMTDTFMTHFTPGEAAAALAHELGHRGYDTLFTALYKTIALCVLLLGFAMARCLQMKYSPCLDSEKQLFALVFFSLMSCSLPFMPLRGFISRLDEKQADAAGIMISGNRKHYHRLLLKGARINYERLAVPRWLYLSGAAYPMLIDRVSDSRSSWGLSEETLALK